MSLHVLASNLLEAKALQAGIPWYYTRMLTWTQKNGIIKAYPKKPLSMAAHKTIVKSFKRLGGAFVSHNGDHYYELMVEPCTSTSTEAASKLRKAFEELQKETQR